MSVTLVAMAWQLPQKEGSRNSIPTETMQYYHLDVLLICSPPRPSAKGQETTQAKARGQACPTLTPSQCRQSGNQRLHGEGYRVPGHFKLLSCGIRPGTPR